MFLFPIPFLLIHVYALNIKAELPDRAGYRRLTHCVISPMWNSQRRQSCADSTEELVSVGSAVPAWHREPSGMVGTGWDHIQKMLAQCCGLNKNRCIVYLKQVNFMACKLYLNKAVREEKDSALSTARPHWRGWGPSLLGKGKAERQHKGRPQKDPLPSPRGHNCERDPSRSGQAIWPQTWLLVFQDLLGKYRPL